jgi:tetrahydromethanopterin S-methyltransferase subunit B
MTGALVALFYGLWVMVGAMSAFGVILAIGRIKR